MSNHKHLIHPVYRPDIDGLRGLAVLLVVVFHAFPTFLKGGFIGVDIFFVISGFLITTIISENLKQDRFSFLEFYTRRIKRIFPALLIVLITTHIFGWFSLSSGEYKQLGKHIVGGASFISNFFFWNESGYFDNSAETKPLLHLWSLGIEEQFYIFFPLIFYFSFRLKISLKKIIILGFLISFAINIALAVNYPSADFYSPVSRFWEILAGGMLTQVDQIKTNIKAVKLELSNLFSIAGFLLIAIGLIFIDSGQFFPGWYALLPVIGAMSIIYAGPSAYLNKFLLSNKLSVFLGLISFPLYLVHWPLLTFWRLSFIHEVEAYVYIGIIGASIGVSWIIYALVETRIRQNKSSGLTSALIIGMIGIGFIGFNCYQREGMPFRKIVQEKFNYQLNDANGKTNCLNTLLDGHIICSPVTQDMKVLRPMVFVWGDSHASHLNAGLLNLLQSQKLSFMDYSYSACPPVLNFEPRGSNSNALHENDICLKHNADALKFIQKYRPETVVLAANWSQYDGLNQFNALMDLEIENTINLLKSSNIKNIVLMGNFPVFYVDQPKLASEYFVAKVNNRTYKRFNYSSLNSDNKMANFAQAHALNFISPMKNLCDREGCILSVSDVLLIPAGLDTSHLTKEGSIYFIQKLTDSGQLIAN